jgi:TonB family protein
MKGSKWIFFFAMIVITGIGAVTVSAQKETTRFRVVDKLFEDEINDKAVSMPKAEYPEALKGTGERGIFGIRVEVNEEGKVVSANLAINERKAYRINPTTGEEESYIPDPPHPLIVEAARVAALEAKFKPEIRDGRPSGFSGVLVYDIFDRSVVRVPQQISGGILNSKATSLPRPAYPPAARAIGADGLVTVQVLIDEEGNVISAKAVSGHPLLRAASVQAAREAKFAPTMLSGQPVKVSGVITYNFVAP